MTEVGRVLASGRDGDIFEFGPGLVLRRTKRGRVIAQEARVMEYAAARGYPVPQVHEVRLVLARAFMARYRDLVTDARVASVAELKMLDGNMQPDEIARCRRLADRRRRRRRVSTGRTDSSKI